MIKETVSLENIIAFLNNLLLCDPKAIESLINTRVECNEALADHRTVQVAQVGHIYEVGILGILNGIFGIHEEGSLNRYGELCIVYDDAGKIVRFGRTSKELS